MCFCSDEFLTFRIYLHQDGPVLREKNRRLRRSIIASWLGLLKFVPLTGFTRSNSRLKKFNPQPDIINLSTMDSLVAIYGCRMRISGTLASPCSCRSRQDRAPRISEFEARNHYCPLPQTRLRDKIASSSTRLPIRTLTLKRKADVWTQKRKRKRCG